MAVTDDQLVQLCDWAFELGRDGVLADPSDGAVISAVFDRAQIENMRTEDEFNEIVTPDDIPDRIDIEDILARYSAGVTEYHRKGGSLNA